MKDKVTLNKNVLLTGYTSFFTDISSEMIYPLLQAFVSSLLATQKVLIGPVLGVIEGIAESTASLLKLFAGYYSDRIEKRKAPAIAGYALSAVSKILFFLGTFGWYFVLFARFFDRVGKGVRSAPRDALISESVPKEIQGRAFGFQRAMDFAGATLGVFFLYVISLRLIDPVTNNLRNLKDFYFIFLISTIPAFIAVIFLFFVKETQKTGNGKVKPRPNLDFRTYDPNLQMFFLAQFIFTLGNSSNQFLLLRSMNLGYTLSAVVLMYLVFNLSSTLLSSWFGSLSDRIGRKKLLISGYLIYAVVYGAFGFLGTGTKGLLWIFWILYGVYYAMTEGVEKAFVSELAPDSSRATALGFYHTIVGIGLLPASLIAGFLFSVTARSPFVFGSAMGLLTVMMLILFVKEKRR